jgi:hypothetical protein
MHALEKESETLPDAQGLQIKEPISKNVPAGHREHDDDPNMEYIPPGQYWQIRGVIDVTYVPLPLDGPIE